MAEPAPRAVFCFDLASPYAYLAAERISGIFAEAGAEQPEWQPVLVGALFARFGRTSWGLTAEREAGIAECERRASAYGLPPFRWPEPWPGNSMKAMRAAIFAKQIGRSTSYTLAAFRQAFAAARDLTELDNVLIAAAAAEMHPRAVSQAVERQAIKDELRTATEAAGDRGVFGVPSVIVGDEVFWGDDRLEAAAQAATRA